MNSMNRQEPSKRLDLQGIRGLAILAVLGFHFFPGAFPNGYLGVDQFFVLSGFLMCMLLKRAENEPAFTLIGNFYYKRLKRILPLYLLVILVGMICLYTFFPDISIETNQKSATRALFFVSNRPSSLQDDYFSMLSMAIDIFTHTWSLSVEVQFYILVPFMFLIVTRLPARFHIASFAIIGITSLLHFNFSPAPIAFNSVFARVWQFIIGMLVYLKGCSMLKRDYTILSDKEEDCKFSKELAKSHSYFNNVQASSYSSLAVLIILTFLPFTLSSSIIRPLVTIGTGCLMLTSEGNPILSNKILSYIGDISYSLYLIHWPIYAYWKLTCKGDSILLICALISSIVLAIFTFETFEKWYLKISNSSLIILVTLLFVSNGGLIKKNQISNEIYMYQRNITSLDDITSNMTVDDAIRLNYQWNVDDGPNLFVSYCVYESDTGPFGWCNHTGLSPSGKYKIAVFGNSWAANHGEMIHQECGHKAKIIIQGSANACDPLYFSPDSVPCRKNFTDFEERVRLEKPDFAFMLTRYLAIGELRPPNVTTLEQDSVYQVMKQQILKLSENVKYKIYIMNAFPRIDQPSVEMIAKWLKNGTSPEEVDKRLFNSKDAVIEQQSYELTRERYAQLEKDCGGKCILVDYKPTFFNPQSGFYRMFDDRGFSYYTSGLHLTPHGVELVRPIWRNICDSL
ncbi:Acyl_transf_3 domain-containing protein [Caenorhabditis elegans]|uniref:Acyl_transf_3 domain-containing protein n=1 Tax=Caenorhabditis elegans TaxID=6239 RepID=O45506_CAEEL|nr:Acyl_transf_3 domain-containing protein [Caenorhabditis elegans]CAB04373.1 Acyl_transf_3 domain-containing protein [Caenorhabditis elegans]|eukprot:NP_493091.1 O-ACyltransferase homolog [Caenorhabditis elegans]